MVHRTVGCGSGVNRGLPERISLQFKIAVFSSTANLLEKDLAHAPHEC